MDTMRLPITEPTGDQQPETAAPPHGGPHRPMLPPPPPFWSSTEPAAAPAPPPPRAPTRPADGDPPPRGRRPRRFGVAVVVASLIAGTTGGWYAGRADGSASTTADATSLPVQSASAGSTDGAMDVKAVVAALKNSVVSIETETTVGRGPAETTGQGAGTGIVLEDGLILTNAHVVAGSSSITITAPGDDSPRAATVVASDQAADIAVLRVADTSGLVPATLGDSSSVEVGDDVVAIGNALALEGGLTVTSGIVSATDREVDTDSGKMTGLIQTDAAISSGNSGGPLVNAAGQVVGINSAVATSSGSVAASNIGFAIAINTARSVVDHLTGDSI